MNKVLSLRECLVLDAVSRLYYADNVVVTAGTGTTVAADEVVDGTLGTVKVQYVKLMDGTLDSTTKISPATSANQTTANTSLATIATNTGNIPASPSTSAKQDTGNTSLASIDTKTPALGQALAAASVPVILPSATVSTLTPPSNTGYALDASLSTLDTDVKSNITLHAGGNIIGIVTTDQTTHGTTDLVAADITKIGGIAQSATNGLPVVIGDNINQANVLKSDGTAAGQNAQLVAGTYKEVSFTTTTVQAVASTDVSNYKWVSVQITSQGTSSTVTFQGSNDNTNWQNVGLMPITSTGANTGTQTSTNAGMWVGPLSYRYFRLNVTGISAGTTAGVMELYTQPSTNMFGATVVSQNGGWTASVSAASATGSAVPANAFYMGVSDNSANLVGLKQAGLVSGTTGQGLLGVGAMIYDGNVFQTTKTPSIFKTATATASGNTALWTPTSGKKFRLMGYIIHVPGNAAISGGGVVVDITFQDATTDIGVGHSLFIPTAAGTTMGNDFNSGFISLGNGKLSALANNVLNVNLSSTLTTGKVRVTAIGTEE